MDLPGLVERVQVVSKSAVTFLVGLAAAVAALSQQVAPTLPEGWQDNAVSVGGAVSAALLGAVAIIRRVTGVPEEERGLL